MRQKNKDFHYLYTLLKAIFFKNKPNLYMRKAILFLNLMICAAAILIFTSCNKYKTYAILQQRTISFYTNYLDVSSTYAAMSFLTGDATRTEEYSTNKWDFGLANATLIFNSHASGPGNAGVILADKAFNDITEAPETGYAYDTTSTNLAISNYTLWADYDPLTFSFVPKKDKTFIIRTGDSTHYAKMEIIGVNADPFGPVGYPRPGLLIYQIRYSIQLNGTRKFTVGS